MLRSKSFGFRLSPREKALLLAVSQKKERTAADVLRRLIRQEAQHCGFLPTDSDQTNTERNEGEARQEVQGDG